MKGKAAMAEFEIKNGILKKYNGPGGDVAIPDGVTKIGEGAFEECKDLASVVIPDGVTKIGNGAFWGCRDLASVVIPDSVTSISWNAFYDCPKATFIISDAVANRPENFVIKNGTLKEYVGLGGDVIIPDGVTHIGEQAFYSLPCLNSVTFPDSIQSIHQNAFSGRSKVEFIISDAVANRPENFVIKDNILKKYKGPGGNVIIPDGVLRISTEAFDCCECLTSVIIPEGVRNIDERAFYFCDNLKTVKIPDSVTEIVSFTFSNCSNPQFIVSENSANRSENFVIENGVLKRYKGPGGEVIIPDEVSVIEFQAFGYCNTLMSIIIPESVTKIEERAFLNCGSLRKVRISGSVESIGSYVFAGCGMIEKMEVSSKIKGLGKDPFGAEFPPNLVNGIEAFFNTLTDASLKKYILNEDVWKKLSSELQEKIYLTRQGKSLQEAYCKCVRAEMAEQIGKTLLNMLNGKVAVKECTTTGNFLISFFDKISVELLNELYNRLKVEKNGGKALKTVEEHVALMDILGNEIKMDDSLTPVMQKVMSGLIEEKISLKDLEKNLKDYYGLMPADLPKLETLDGSMAEVSVLSWLLTVHEKLEKDTYGPAIVVEKFKKPGVCPRTKEVVDMLNPSSLQSAILELANRYLVRYENGKKRFLTYPICRYADESTMSELTGRAPKWRTSVSGNDAPLLRQFRKANCYSNTRASMIFAERYNELDEYARLRGVTSDTLRDLYLSDVGLDMQGCKTYDLGNQIVIVRLQNDLSFLVELTSGKTAKSLPKKGADEGKYAAAKADFDEMRKSVKKILKNREMVLLKEYLNGRTRESGEWQAAYIKNPLLRKAAGQLVWAQGKETFTLTDHEAVDSIGNTYNITDEVICVAHPMEMDVADVTAWQKYFTAKGLKQPFQQIWEPVVDPKIIKEDRYLGCMIPYYRFNGQSKHGITIFDFDFHNDITINISDCNVYVERIDWRRHEIRMEDRFEIKKFGFKKYTRQVNHIVAYFDRITIWDRVRKDDVGVIEMLGGFTFAQIMEFISVAQESNAINVLALLLEYKNKNFSEFNPMEEFVLEW